MIRTQKYETLQYLTADGITVPHGFTTRLGGVSTGTQSSLNLAVGRGDSLENVEENLRRLGRAVGFDPEKLVMTLQIHSDIVRVVTEKDHIGLCHRDYPKCDALVTNTPGVALLVFTADCTPLLFFDPVTGAVGAAHAGWRGTAQAIGAKVVHAMAENFGAKPENIRAAIGPCIGPCCFETDADVPDAMRAALGSEAGQAIRPAGAKFYVDLKRLNAIWLRRAGVTCIDVSADCTACQPQRFWSHRRVGNARGSLAAIIRLREEG